MKSNTIFLLGFMGSGKSAVARSLAKRLDWPLVDLDARIESEARKRIAHIFRDEGEAAFRALEAEMLEEVAREEAVVSLGGGAPLAPRNRELLAEAVQNGATVVYLQASAPTLAARIRRSPGKRPLIDGNGVLSLEATQKRVEDLLEQREAIYRECATFIVSTDEKMVPQVAREIVAHLSGQPSSDQSSFDADASSDADAPTENAPHENFALNRRRARYAAFRAAHED